MLSVVFMVSGCDTATDTSSDSVAQANADLRALYSAQYDYLGSVGQADEDFFADPDQMLQATTEFYAGRFGEQSTAVAGLRSAINDRTSDTQTARTEGPSENLVRTAERVETALGDSKSLEEFQTALSTIEESIVSGLGTDSDKVEALNYVVSLSETMTFMDENGLLTASENARGINWRCVGGIASGAVLGGFTGAGRGAVIPLGPYSITAGAVVGAIAGGVAGGVSAC